MKSKPRLPSAREVLATNLRRLRLAREWSQEDLALESGLHRTFVAHVERKMRNISIDNIEKLASALGVSTAELLLDVPHQAPTDREKLR
jgi:transcriptional regulator with XRE-family HTH domain